MNDKSDLLGQLKIDRSAVPDTRRSQWPLAALVVVVALAAGGYLLFRPADAVVVKAATARTAGSGGGSVLDALARTEHQLSAQSTSRG